MHERYFEKFKMKIAILTSGLFKHTGGPPVVISNLINQISNFDDLQITYFGIQGNIHPKMNNLNSSVRVINFRVITKYRFSFTYLSKLISLNPDIIWVHGLWLWPNFAGIMYSFFARKKLLVTPHGVLTKEMFSNKWYKKISIGLTEMIVLSIKKNFKMHYLSKSERDSCVLKKMSLNNQVIPNYVNVRKLNNIVRDREFLFLARIAPIKGIEDVISISNFNCDVYGFGDAEYIKKVVSGNPNFYGEVETYNIEKIFYKYKYYLLPSYGEGLPTSAIEAAMCGCILVVSNQCNLNMFTDGLNAIKFDAGLDNLKDAISRVKKLTKKQTEEIRKNAFKVIQSEFSTQVLNRKYKKYILE
tara:strand:+ start:1506 stop:2579 length:1074 start_codon:yes stop_codon:yes gene_type:complete